MAGRNQSRPDIIRAIHNRQLFGSLPAFKTLATWSAWLVWLKALFALPMDTDELGIFQQCTARTEPPRVEPTEVYTVIGRRGGKSFMAAIVAVFLACFRDFRRYRNTGEFGVVLILARDRDQSKVVFNYIKGVLREVPALRSMIAVERADEIELTNRIVIACKTSDYRSIRGITVVCAIADEVAFWDCQGVSPDREIFSALRPAMSTIPAAKLIVISTGYAQAGELYDIHRRYFGLDNNQGVLVWQSPTRTMNPTISESLIQREMERDPQVARAEWGGGFREDIEAAFSLEMIEACVVPGRSGFAAIPELHYYQFTDTCGGRADLWAHAIAHRRSDVAVIDFIQSWKPPLDPSATAKENAALIKLYNGTGTVGDNYSAEWAKQEFEKAGVSYTRSELTKSELYLNLIPAICSRKVELPDDKVLIDQLRHLERRRGRSGKDTIDHLPRLHDDIANTVAGVVHLALKDTGDFEVYAFGELPAPDWHDGVPDGFYDSRRGRFWDS